MTNPNNRRDPALCDAHPPRYAWLKRLAPLGLAFVLALGALYGIWSYRIHAHLRALIAEIEARGEPIHFQDMIPPPIPDAQNRGALLLEALRTWPPVPGHDETIIETLWYHQPDEHVDPIEDPASYLQAVLPMLASIEQAAMHPETRWDTVYQSPFFFLDQEHDQQSELRSLANLLADAAERAARAGDGALALRCLWAMPPLAEAVNTDPPSVIGHLVAVSIIATLIETLETILPQLDARAERSSLEQLQTWLTDETWLAQSLANGWIGDRWSNHDLFQSLQIRPVVMENRWLRITHRLWQPMVTHDTGWMLRFYTTLIDAARHAHDTLEHFDAHFRQAYPHRGMPDWPTYLENHAAMHRMIAMLLPVFNGARDTHFRLIARQRMAVTAIAFHCFSADHGHRPDSLADLVPTYLATIPADPFSLHAELIRYRPQARLVHLPPPDPMRPRVTPPPVVLDRPGPAILYATGPSRLNHNGTLVIDADGHPSRVLRPEADRWFQIDP